MRSATQRAQFAVVRESGVEPHQILHCYFRAAQRQRESIMRFRFGKRHVRASQKFVKIRMRKLRGE